MDDTLLPLFSTILLLFASAALFFSRNMAFLFGVMTIACSFASGIISAIGLAVIGILGLLLYVHTRVQKPSLKSFLAGLLLLACVLLAAHLLPGFNNPQWLKEEFKSESSLAFSMYLNFDKALVLFILAGLYPFLFDKQVSVSNETLGISPRSKLILILLFGSIFPLAMTLELIELEMGLPSWWWLFALNNLLITCTVEEAFFRGALQGQVLNRFGAVSALLISSVLFGAAHFAGGLEYVLVATIAGLGYGYVYASTGRLSLAVLSHFAVNFIHLAFFTYPKLAPIDL